MLGAGSLRCPNSWITFGYGMLIWISIECTLATKFGGEAKAHEISNTQKEFEQILNSLGDIK